MGKFKIKDILPKPRKVFVDEENFFLVKGISLPQIGVLLDQYPKVMELFLKGKGKEPITFKEIVETAPDFVAAVIAFAADCEGQEADIIQLPITVQLDALAEIFNISVPDPKKLLAHLSVLLGTVQPQRVVDQSEKVE